MKNLSLSIAPLTGTQVGWTEQDKQTQLYVKALTNFYIVNEDNTYDLAFSSIIDLNANFTLDVTEEKALDV